MHVLFVEDGEMDKRVFLATWKEIPAANEVQYEIKDVQHNAGNFSVSGLRCMHYSVHDPEVMGSKPGLVVLAKLLSPFE